MQYRTMMSFVLTSLISTSAAFAAANQATNDDDLVTMLHLGYLLGNWDCHGTTYDAEGNAVPTTGRWEFRHHEGTHWLVDTANLDTLLGDHYGSWGWTHYDSHGSTFVHDASDSYGDWSRYETSGWQNDGTMAWHGALKTMLHGSFIVEAKVAKKDHERFWFSAIAQGSKGPWFDVYKGMCRRSDAACETSPLPQAETSRHRRVAGPGSCKWAGGTERTRQLRPADAKRSGCAQSREIAAALAPEAFASRRAPRRRCICHAPLTLTCQWLLP